MNGRRPVIEGLLSLKTIETWIVHVCHSEGERERKYLSAAEHDMVVGARHTGLCEEALRCLKINKKCKCSTVSCVYQEWSTTQ